MEKKLLTDKNFFLYKVDPLAVLEKYKKGTLLITFEKISIDATPLSPDLQVGTDHDSAVYEISNKYGETVRIVTTDHNKWMKEREGTPVGEYICHWCRIKNTGKALVLPLQIDRDLATGNLIFYGTGSYCCFECAYADLKTKVYPSFYYRDYLYRDSESLLRFMYFLYHKEVGNFTSAPLWTLHEKNGGELPDKDFFSNKHTYVSIPNIIINTVKTTYIQSNK